MELKTLHKYNQSLLSSYNPKRYAGAINCVMPGYFAGNKVLFIAQNPGELKDDVEADMLYLSAFKEGNYDKLTEYYVEALKSPKGTYGTFINDVYGDDWDSVSFTNVLKCPFSFNVMPTEIEFYDYKVLKDQIDLLAPVHVVSVGALAHNALEILKVQHVKFFHPSFLRRKNMYDSLVNEYREILQKVINT